MNNKSPDPKEAMTLSRGQVPIDELVRLEKAHDVRTLRVCGSCGGMGNNDRMIEHGTEWLHGRCFVARYGKAELCQLPQAQTDRMSMNDLGLEVMKYLVNHRSRS
jgi:hypothetical protein